MDSSLHLVPGRYKLPTAPGGSLRKDSPGWEKAETKFTAISSLPACGCVCVCVLCRLHIYTCVFQGVVCAIKNLTKVLIIKMSPVLLQWDPERLQCLCTLRGHEGVIYK